MSIEPLQADPGVALGGGRPAVLSPSSDQRARRARIAIGVLAAGVAWASLPFLAGLLGAVVLAVLLAPLYRRIAPRIGPRRAAFLLALASVLLFAVPIALLLAWAIAQAPNVLQQVLASTAFARLADLRVGPLDVGAQLAEAGRTAVA